VADTKVEDEAAAAALTGTEDFYCVQGGAPRKVTAEQIAVWTASPPAASARDLGTLALPWGGAFFGSGASIDFGAGNAHINHSANLLTLNTPGIQHILGSQIISAVTYSYFAFYPLNGYYFKTGQTGIVVAAITFADGTDTVCGSIGVDTTANTTAYNTSSDKRGKPYRKRLKGALDLINKVEIWDHTDKRNLINGVGPLAQDLQKVIPPAVSVGDDRYGKLKINSKGELAAVYEGLQLWQYDPSKLVPYLIAAVQELSAEVAELKSQRRVSKKRAV
jgi:hypothetical protein